MGLLFVASRQARDLKDGQAVGGDKNSEVRIYY